MSPLFWAALLLLLGLCLAVMEVFIPSGGILGFLSGASVVASVILAFYADPMIGLGFLTVVAIGGPLLVALAVKIWPHTPVGRAVLIHLPEHQDDVLPDTEFHRQLKTLVGRRGVATAKMLPSGAVRVDGRVYDATSDGVTIAVGETVEVVRVEGTRVFVRKVSPGEPRGDAEAAERRAENILEQPVEQLGLDSLDDPLA